MSTCQETQCHAWSTGTALFHLCELKVDWMYAGLFIVLCIQGYEVRDVICA